MLHFLFTICILAWLIFDSSFVICVLCVWYMWYLWHVGYIMCVYVSVFVCLCMWIIYIFSISQIFLANNTWNVLIYTFFSFPLCTYLFWYQNAIVWEVVTLRIRYKDWKDVTTLMAAVFLWWLRAINRKQRWNEQLVWRKEKAELKVRKKYIK